MPVITSTMALHRPRAFRALRRRQRHARPSQLLRAGVVSPALQLLSHVPVIARFIRAAKDDKSERTSGDPWRPGRTMSGRLLRTCTASSIFGQSRASRSCGMWRMSICLSYSRTETVKALARFPQFPGPSRLICTGFLRQRRGRSRSDSGVSSSTSVPTRSQTLQRR
jgi:hypothetical protein